MSYYQKNKELLLEKHMTRESDREKNKRKQFGQILQNEI